MEYKKLEINQLFEGLKVFVKEQFKRLDTWVMITLASYLGAIGCSILIGILSALYGLYFIYIHPIIFNLQGIVLQFSLLTIITLLFGFLIYKTIKKSLGIANSLALNILAAVEHKPLPKFQERDERLSFIWYMLLFFIGIILGFIFLIIPGIIFFVRCGFGYYIMLDEKCSPLEALKKSWNMTEGNFWPIFIMVFPLFLIGFIPYLNLFNILYMFIPLNLWVCAYIYNQLKEQQK